MTILTLATTTVLETVRRRVVAIAALVSLVAIVGVYFGFARLADATHSEELVGISAVLTIILSFAFSVVLAVGASFLAAPSIGGDLESGIALAILPRPISRVSYVFGKWLGLAALVAAYAAVFGAMGYAAVWLGAGYQPPHEDRALAYLSAESIALFTLALALSTRLAPIAGGILAVAAFGASWIAGITASIARGLDATALAQGASLVQLVIPTDGLWRGAVFELTPVAMLIGLEQRGARGVNPFGVTSPPTTAFLIWSAIWIVGALLAAIASMRTRDV